MAKIIRCDRCKKELKESQNKFWLGFGDETYEVNMKSVNPDQDLCPDCQFEALLRGQRIQEECEPQTAS